MGQSCVWGYEYESHPSGQSSFCQPKHSFYSYSSLLPCTLANVASALPYDTHQCCALTVSWVVEWQDCSIYTGIPGELAHTFAQCEALNTPLPTNHKPQTKR